MAEPIVVKEYSINIKIKDCDLGKLHHYLECQHLDSALKVTPSGIETTSWVGVIKYKNTHFQILPKLICNNGDKENILKKSNLYAFLHKKVRYKNK